MSVDIKALAGAQKKFFESGVTFDIEFRLNKLRAFKRAVEDNLTEIAKALRADLGKSASESYMCETGLVLGELTHTIKNLKKWAAPQKVKTPLSQAVAKSYRLPSPRGNALIISPWNYPFLLSADPLVEAIAAGNTVLLKTASASPATGEVLRKLVSGVFEPEHAVVIEGGEGVNEAVAECVFDHVFFTGGASAGRKVYENAARNLTPVTLELGGKSPCIVDSTAVVPLAARRIVWGKFLNLGQTCVAPDYVLADARVYDRLVEEIKKQIELQFGAEPLDSPDYGRMVSRKHFDRVAALISPEKVIVGGKTRAETLQIEPTVLGRAEPSDPVMQEEIFGPVLPVLPYGNESEAVEFVRSRPAPLALYFFSSDRRAVKRVTRSLSFGGGCVNDTVTHLSTPYLPFGGVGQSGTGAYHGKAGFDTFSHYKSILDKKTWIDPSMRYRPYSERHDKTVRKFLK